MNDGWRSIARGASAVVHVAFFSAASTAQQITPTERDRIDGGARAILDATGAPGASFAIVRGTEIVYERAYGDGRIDPDGRIEQYIVQRAG